MKIFKILLICFCVSNPVYAISNPDCTDISKLAGIIINGRQLGIQKSKMIDVINLQPTSRVYKNAINLVTLAFNIDNIQKRKIIKETFQDDALERCVKTEMHWDME
jgi:hypothetical protein